MAIERDRLRLYAVTDRSWTRERPLCEQVEQALRGGVTMVQLREKNLAQEEFLREANEVGALCRRFGVPFLINDNVEVALACGADGVHLGQTDRKPEQARRLLGADKIIGVSARTVEQALAAQEQGADYLGSGAVFGTATKEDAKPLSFEDFSAICHAVSIPVVAIGGVAQDNIPQLAGSGMAGVAVIRALFASRDITAAAERMRCEVDQLMLAEKKLQGAIFDMDGVLLDSMPVWETITGRYLATQGIFTETDCNAFVATKTMTGGAEYLRTHFPLEKTTEQIVNEIVALILKAYQEEIPAKPGAAELLQALQKAGVKVTVATASARELVTPAFERTGLSKYIDGVFTCPEVGIGKEESPAVYDRAREFMGTDRAHSLVFEDSLHGIRTAKKAGYLTAGIHDPSSEKEQDAIRGLVDLYLESLEDARYIV